jgi:hypothetical protein
MAGKGWLIAVGIFMIALGMRAAFSDTRSRNTLGALVALLGLAASLIGTLVLCVPGFFS